MKSRLFLFIALMVPALALADGPVAGNAPGSVPTILPAGASIKVPADAPKIACAHPKFNFGSVDEGPDLTHEFVIRNRGKSVLKITNVSTSCGCTAAVEDKKEILPGGLGKIKATYHTQGRPGHATKVITVTSNDPVNPSFQLQLDMTVMRDVDIQPSNVYFYGAKHGKAQTVSLRVTGKPGTNFKVLSAKVSGGVVSVASITPFVDEKEKKTGSTLEISLPATQPFGNFSDELTLTTNYKKKKEIKVPVMGEVMGKVQYYPRTLSFAPRQDAPVTVNFTADSPELFAVRSVETKNHLVRPYIKKILTANGGNQYMLIASVIKDIPKESDGKDTIIVHTNDEEQPEISIEVQASK
jgi:hypothetical protein